MRANVFWDPRMLNAALLSAYKPSIYVARETAKRTAPTKKAGAVLKEINASSLQTASSKLMPTGLGWVFEKGGAGGYPIFPNQGAGLRRVKGKAITAQYGAERFYALKSKGGFSSSAGAIAFNSPGPGSKSNTGVVPFTFGGDMKPDQYINPSSVKWARSDYPTQASRTLQSRGFGRGNVR